MKKDNLFYILEKAVFALCVKLFFVNLHKRPDNDVCQCHPKGQKAILALGFIGKGQYGLSLI